jgi:hypothetical protein
MLADPPEPGRALLPDSVAHNRVAGFAGWVRRWGPLPVGRLYIPKTAGTGIYARPLKQGRFIKMKRIVLLIILALLAMPLLCEPVKSDVLTSKYGVSITERQESDYIEKDGYSFQYIGDGEWEITLLSETEDPEESEKRSSGLKGYIASDFWHFIPVYIIWELAVTLVAFLIFRKNLIAVKIIAGPLGGAIIFLYIWNIRHGVGWLILVILHLLVLFIEIAGILAMKKKV